MAMLRKDVNFGLMILLVALVIAFVSFTLFFHAKFSDLYNEYSTKLNHLTNVTTTLQQQKNVLNKTSYELEQKTKREEDFNVKYTNVRDERDNLQSNNEKLSSDLLKKTSELNARTAELSTKTRDIAALNILVSDLRVDVSTLQKKADNYKDDLDEACDDLATAGINSGGC